MGIGIKTPKLAGKNVSPAIVAPAWHCAGGQVFQQSFLKLYFYKIIEMKLITMYPRALIGTDSGFSVVLKSVLEEKSTCLTL